MTTSLAGKVALVTGAGSGIGAATAGALAAAGARVVVTDVAAAAAASVAGALEGATARALDVTSERDWAAALDDVRERHGRLDVFVNNAGISAGAPLAEVDLEGWRRVMAVNVEGALLGLRAAAPLLRVTRGCVVNVASASGRKAQPGAAAYCTSKAALLMLSRVAALELAPQGVRVNCVLPGGVKTPMWEGMAFFRDLVAQTGGVEQAYASLASDTPLGRFCEPREVAAAIVMLAGDDAAAITGAELVIDGGYTV